MSYFFQADEMTNTVYFVQHHKHNKMQLAMLGIVIPHHKGELQLAKGAESSDVEFD